MEHGAESMEWEEQRKGRRKEDQRERRKEGNQGLRGQKTGRPGKAEGG